ncbi:hypothetical protein [Cecembia rubra]|uniref:Dual-action HEIGH metallo-peptidase n=1 Tax=Cecembia rubra TaxID=1485585 RepID=A0A2P8EAH5_9BACT|nr:hypothetical protein [Cecembia rubra]PSL06447.1 hypothetical protein CLV48_102263 [Cecembia rubra]
MKYYSQFILASFLIFGILACETDEDPNPTPQQEEFPDLKIFLDRFENEAKLRGFNFDFSVLDISYTDEIRISPNEVYCGYGYIRHPQTGRRTVVISKSINCDWANKTDLERENLFFHEIGHAFFNLPHDNALKCDGKPLSLMTEAFNQFFIYRENEPELRSYYLDELFDRLAANQQCIDFGQDFESDPVFFKKDINDSMWRFSSDNGNYGINGGINEASGNPFFQISSEGTGQNTGYAFRQIDAPNIPEGATVRLRTKISSENLEGPGVAIALRVYQTAIGQGGASTVESHFLSTEMNPINGKLDNELIELTLTNFTRKTIFMIPFAVMMPRTKGKANFDDFEILVEPGS